MPELPEVEIVVRNLNEIVKPAEKMLDVTFFRKDLRNPFPLKVIRKLYGCTIKKIYRRAKFIVFEFDEGCLISHLGMTGYWRLEKSDWLRKIHDHIAIQLAGGRYLIYNDARRFGEFDFYTYAELDSRFQKLGPEPLDSQTDWVWLTTQFKKLKTEIKVALMNQKYLVGVGNIYASEALFRAKIKPTRKANRVSQKEYSKLWTEVKIVLLEAIQAGGSSIQNYQNGYGKKGDFQSRFAVYDRAGMPCLICNTLTKITLLSGRSSFWCPRCQK